MAKDQAAEVQVIARGAASTPTHRRVRPRLRLLALWLALIVMFPLTIAAIASVMLAPHPVELVMLAVLFAAAGVIGTRMIVRRSH